MTKKPLLLTLLLAILAPWAAQAQTLTVCDGTDNSNVVPFDGYNADAAQHNQMIFPATDLTAMNGKEITQMVFYIDQSASNGSNTAANRLGTWTVSLGETTATTLDALDNTTPVTQVYEGYFDCSTGTLTLDFDNEYTYNGGNLLVDLNHAAASWNRWYFLGVSQTTNTAYTYSYPRQFLPKTTFTYETPSSCAKPTGLAVNYNGDGTATASWTSDASAFNIDIDGTVTNNVTNPYTFNVDYNTTYAVSVQADCGSEQSGWTSSVSLTTPCAAIAVPYSYGFEDASDLNCWDVVSTSSNTGIATADDAAEGSKVFRFYYSETNAYLISPVFSGTERGLDVAFQYMNSSTTTTYTEQFQVGYTTDAAAAPADFTYDETIYGENQWMTYENTFPANTKRIAIKYIYTDAYYLRLDDFSFNVASSCPKPTGLAVSNITGHEATLSWTSAADAWQICVNDDEENLIDVTDTTYTLTGLAPETAYTVKVRTNCGDEYSDWKTVNFTTDVACPAPTGLAVSNITGHEATLSWTSAADAWQICVNDDEENLIDVTETTYNITGLAPETAYTVKVRANCGDDGESDWTDNVSFTTDIACPAPTNVTASNLTANSANIAWTGNDDATGYNLRYRSFFLQGFESGMGDWTTIDADEDGYNWVLGSQAEVYIYSGNASGLGHNSSNDLIISGSYRNSSETSGEALNPDNYLVSPMINLGGTISFYAHGSNMSYVAEHFGVFVSTNSNNNPDDFVMVNEWTASTTEFIQYSADLSAYSGQGYVAIRHFNCTDQFLLSVDDITITEPEAVNPWTLIEDVTNPYTLTELTDNTSYEVQVQVVCGGEDGESAWVGTSLTTYAVDAVPFDLQADVMATAATLNWYGVQDSYNVRYRENPLYYFNPFNTEEDRAGWTFSKTIYGIEDPVYNLSETSNFVLAMGWETTAEDFIYSPALPAYPSGSTLEFYHFYLNEANTFQVGYSTTTNDATAFTWSNPIAATVSYQNGAYTVKYSQVLPDGVKYVAFKATAASQAASIFIDNFKIYNAAAIDVWEETVSNVNARTLEITGLTPETEYEWQVQGNMTNGTTAWSERAFFTTKDVIIWNEPEDWPNDSVPEAYADVTIPANTLVIIPSGYTAYADTITIEEGGSILIENGGQLLHSNPVPVTMEFVITGYGRSNNGYHLLAMPINPSVTVGSTGLNTGDYDLYYFDQEQDLEWINVKDTLNNDNFTTLDLGKGYLYANTVDVIPFISGQAIPTSGIHNVPLDYVEGKAFAGWNLLGNPYTAKAYIDRPFYVLNNDGDEVENEAHTAGEPIGVFQGFFVKADATGDVCNFSTVPYGGGVGLNMTVNQGRSKKDNAIITFGGGQTLEKFQLNPNHTKVYMTVDGKDYAIVDAPEMGEMPVSFKAETSGTYTLSFSSENVSFGYLRLIDNMTGVETNLLETPSYTFEASTTDYANRFKLVFATGNSNDDNFAFFSNGNLVISNEGEATLQVVDVTGRIVRSESINGCANVGVNVAPGVYMLRLVNGNDVKVQKVVVR